MPPAATSALPARVLPHGPSALPSRLRSGSTTSSISISSSGSGSQHEPWPQQLQWRRQRRRRLVVPTAAVAATAQQRDGTAARPRHFLRPSLLATGLREPADVLQHCLALFRKADLAELRQYLPDSYAAALDATSAAAAAAAVSTACPAAAAGNTSSSSGSSSGDGSSSNSGSNSGGSGGSSSPQLGRREPWLSIEEQGPLAPLAGVLDVGARRVLPGHLLRRSQVLSTLRPGPDAFQQRVQLTACGGETSVFEWHLALERLGEEQREEGEAASGGGRQQGSSVGGGSSVSGGRWVLQTVRRDPSSDVPLPTTPHPKAAPEAIVRAQLAALQQGDVFGASCFNMRAGPRMSSRKTSLVSHHGALRAQLQREPYGMLLRHAAVQLGAAVLPTQRDMLQEVAVLAADGASARFVWRLTLSSHGCWMTSAIFSAEDAAAALAGARQ